MVGRAPLVISDVLLRRRINARPYYYLDQTIEASHTVCNAKRTSLPLLPYGATCLTNDLCFPKWHQLIPSSPATTWDWPWAPNAVSL